MKALCSALAMGLLAIGSAHAQRVEQPVAPWLTPVEPANPFAGIQPVPRAYGANETDNPNDKLIPGGYRTTPKLVGGFQFSPNLAIEGGYVDLRNRGFHYVEEGRADERAGALGVDGFSSYAAGKYSVPLTERLTAYGKLGIAYSQRKARRGDASDTGPYSGVGAQYKLSDQATVTAEYVSYGNPAKQLGRSSNAEGLKAKLKVGF
ncbi:outer membrane beta-barrel protein [Massilia niastensis]|uniref:outer membrane beta-barrel protein n=1 Tax=Massilia niastensis TaxID=544911 RepID=UPI0003A6A735|nr:outer membrane beta-barrel protein [Massilia niastensis]